MANEMRPPYSLGGSGGGMADLYATMLSHQAKTEQEQFNRAQGTVASLINSYHAAGSVSMKEQITDTMRSYYVGLSTPLR